MTAENKLESREIDEAWRAIREAGVLDCYLKMSGEELKRVREGDFGSLREGGEKIQKYLQLIEEYTREKNKD